MKKFLILIVLFNCITYKFAAAKSVGSVDVVMKLYDWPPFYYGKRGSSLEGGVVVPVVRKLIERLNKEYSTKFDLSPIKIALFKEILGEIKLGTTHMTLGGHNPDREKYAVFSDPIFEVRWYFFYLKSRKDLFNKIISLESSVDSKKIARKMTKKESKKINIKKASDVFEYYDKLKGFRIGLIKGYNYGLSFYKTSLEYFLDMRYSDSPKASLIKLINGKLDVVVLSEAVKKWIFKNNSDLSRRQIEKLGRPIRSKYYLRLFVSKKSPLSNEIDHINKILQSMKQKQGDEESYLKRQLGDNAAPL